MEPPVAIVQAVGPPSWERGCSGPDDHAFVFEGILEGGTDPGAEVDVALGAQSGEGVVEFWRDTDQQGFIFHLISEYITAFTGDHEVDGGGPEC